MVTFQTAERSQAKARIALCGPSGAGKTHSALLLAAGLGTKIAVVDTESASASLEAGKEGIPAFDVAVMSAPFDPIKYIAAINDAARAGYDVIILDSLSHAWAGSGGLLEKKDAMSAQSKSGSWDAWRKITPQHNKLVEAILQSPLHVIATMRSKQEYLADTDEKTHKISIRKVGLAPVQREGMDYEFTIVLDIDQQSHAATASKDRTSLFDGQVGIISRESGEKLKAWLAQGKVVEAPKPPEPPVAPPTPPPAAPIISQSGSQPTPPLPPETVGLPPGYMSQESQPELLANEGQLKAIADLMTQKKVASKEVFERFAVDMVTDGPKMPASLAQEIVNWLISGR